MTATATFNELYSRPCHFVKEKEFKKTHQVFDGAPNDWAQGYGATHTLFCGEGPGKGTRPAKLLKTVLYVGVDELPHKDGGIKWEKWIVRHV